MAKYLRGSKNAPGNAIENIRRGYAQWEQDVQEQRGHVYVAGGGFVLHPAGRGQVPGILGF